MNIWLLTLHRSSKMDSMLLFCYFMRNQFRITSCKPMRTEEIPTFRRIMYQYLKRCRLMCETSRFQQVVRFCNLDKIPTFAQ